MSPHLAPIIPPVAREQLVRELRPELRLRTTNKAGNEIYILTGRQAPGVLREIGRLRELAFRAAGGGTGKPCDLDEFDTGAHPYIQLIVWSPEDQEILGGYRFLPSSDVQYTPDGQPRLATSHMFHFSEKFLRDYMPQTVELGRSFVTLENQSSRGLSRTIFALDNLWDGLGALTLVIPGLRYFFGKMTMYPSFNRPSRDMILYFLHKHFGDQERLITPLHPIQPETGEDQLRQLFPPGIPFKEDYHTLNTQVRRLGFNIPPLVNAYMGLSPTMRVFGTAVNHEFGEVEETGILIAFDEILEEKRRRHIDSFALQHPESIRLLRNIFLKDKTPDDISQ